MVEHPLHGCPAGCSSALCAYNDDPSGEAKILLGTHHYSEIHALEILLRRAGFSVAMSNSGEPEGIIRPDYFWAAIDRVLAGSKVASRFGGREDLGRYDERFAGLFVTWEPARTGSSTTGHWIPGALHVIHIERRGGSPPHSGDERVPSVVPEPGEVLLTSGPPFPRSTGRS